MARLVEQVLNQILQAQVPEQLKAAPDERTEERQGYRNGTLPQRSLLEWADWFFGSPGCETGSSRPNSSPATSVASRLSYWH